MIPIEIKRNFTHKQFFQINWMLHDRCTYACSYCPPGNHAGTDNWLKLDSVIDTCKNIEAQVKLKYPGIGMQVLLGGGEPTVWKYFPELVRYFHDNHWSIHMVTNLSRSLDWWKSIDVKWNSLNISIHGEYLDHKALEDKIDYLRNNSNEIKLRVMLHPNEKLFNSTIDIANQLKDKFPELVVLWVPILYEFGGVNIDISPYSDVQRTIINELISRRLTGRFYNDIVKNIKFENNLIKRLDGQYAVNFGLNKFKDWSCDAGLDGIFIDGLGNISRGTCREGGTIGHILDIDFKLPSESIICSRNSCTCVTDVFYSKRKI